MFAFFLSLSCVKNTIVYEPLPKEVQRYKEPVDEYAAPLIEQGWMTSLSIGLIHAEGVEFYNYGVHRKGSNQVPTKDSIYEIGSVSKVLTATLLAEGHITRGIPLDKPIRTWSLKDWTFPQKDDVEITALQLATHTSGLPRLPFNFFPKDFRNPYAHMSADTIQQSLKKTNLENTPGTKIEYSNLGAGILGHALATHHKTNYERLLQQKIAIPLGMSSTFVDVPTELQSRTVQGHDMANEPTPDWDMPSLEGMGAVNSTAFDLTRFVWAQLSPSEHSLGKAIQLTHESRVPFSKEDNSKSMAMGWHIGLSDDPDIFWHNGGTGGGRSFVAFDPKEIVGLVILNGNAVPYTDDLAISLMAMLKGEKKSLSLPSFLSLSQEESKKYEGRYAINPQLAFEFTAVERGLRVRIKGQPEFMVYPSKEHFFKSIHAPIGFAFSVDDDGVISQMIMHQGENRVPAQKVDVVETGK